ncbi:MAG: glycosyltransferase family 4 protein, partial [Thermofilaceae archaeon]
FPIAFDIEVGVSEYVTRSLNLRLGARLIGKSALLIYNGIEPNRFMTAQPSPQDRIALGLDQGTLVVGSVGRLTEQKGYAFLLEAASQVIAKIPNVQFLIVGDGELREKLEQQIDRLGLRGRVILAGAHNPIEPIFKLFDLFVLPSLWEGLPTVILEAMASGVPVVATDILGTRELIRQGQTGWLARPRDPSSLAHCILEALSDPSKRAAIAQNALQEVVSRFSLHHIANQYEQLYLDLVNC